MGEVFDCDDEVSGDFGVSGGATAWGGGGSRGVGEGGECGLLDADIDVIRSKCWLVFVFSFGFAF